MTIRGMAESLHTTPMTIYRKLKAAGIDVKALRDAQTKELTGEGITLIGSLFDGVTDMTQAVDSDVISAQQETEQVTQQAIQIARLTAQVEGLTAQVELLKDERERLRHELDAAHEERREAQRLLTTSEPRKSWIARLFRR